MPDSKKKRDINNKREKSSEYLFNALSEVKNYEKLMPDNIAKFEVLGEDIFNFGLAGMPEIKLKLKEGTPTPEYFAQKVNFSNNYLSDVLKKETGKSTKDHIDDFVIELAKTQLVNTKATINEIAYDLGFNYPHYFSRLFKKKTGETPNNYRSQFLN